MLQLPIPNFIVNMTYTHCTTDNRSMRTLRLYFISVIFQAHLGWYCSYIAASCTKILLYVHMRPVITLNYSVKYIRYDARHIYIYIIYIPEYTYIISEKICRSTRSHSLVWGSLTLAPNTSLPIYYNSESIVTLSMKPFIRYQLHLLCHITSLCTCFIRRTAEYNTFLMLKQIVPNFHVVAE